MLQVEYWCEKCEENHFGNCPMITVTLTTSDLPPYEDVEV